MSKSQTLLFAVLGLGRAGKILYLTIFVLAIPVLTVWTVFLPRWKFSDQDERLFRAARHGDVAGIEQSLASGARVDAASPVDGKTALFRAAIFGHATSVRVLLDHGANASIRGSDGQSAAEIALAARRTETNADTARDLDAIVTMLHAAEEEHR